MGNVTILCVAPIAVYVALPFFRRLDITSAYEYLEHRFNVSIQSLKQWNEGIKPNGIIHPKQKLTIYVDVTNLHD